MKKEMWRGKKFTPAMQQYVDIKKQYPDAILFFRMGDFFEMFFEDAELVSQELGIVKTYRNKNNDEPIPMAGVPHHAHVGYVNQLVSAGYTVVICDQVEDARFVKGRPVRREITRVVTPGITLDPDTLDAHSNHYLMSVLWSKRRCGVSLLDATTGTFKVVELAEKELLTETKRINPREILISERQKDLEEVQSFLVHLQDIAVKFRPDFFFHKSDAMERLKDYFGVMTLDGFGVAGMDLAIRAAGAILGYVQETQKGNPPHIDKITPYDFREYMIIDQQTRYNLELLESLKERTKKGSLIGILDRSATAMGGRRIREWLLYPLLDRQRIQWRLDVVEAFVLQGMLREKLRATLKKLHDIERLNSKISSAIATPRDYYTLRQSLEIIPEINGILAELGEWKERLGELQQLDHIEEVAQDIARTLVDEPATTLKDGGIIREGFDDELDELRDIATHGKDRILEMEARERELTGIQSLKIKFNKVFGYFIEVSKPNVRFVPTDRYQRKQTMVNHERFITTELKEFEEKILVAEERSLELERRFFEELRERIKNYGARLADLAVKISQLDALSTFAELAVVNDYCKPKLTDELEISIKGGRHPVVEQMLHAGEFVPNDIQLTTEEGRGTFILLTGPNMSGKSTIMRQVAIIALMAQIGAYVPAQEAVIGICDRIFTRVGASDNLVGGQSTFMVEMTETANILHNATKKSLVILDEIGRGTSTFDGISIAWAVAEFIHNRLGCRTLFATHYHELTELEFILDSFRNMSIAIQERDEEIHFLHTLVEGATNRSYGIQVARLAGLPRSVVRRAHNILLGLEQGKLPTSTNIGTGQVRRNLKNQLSFFAPSVVEGTKNSFVVEELEDLNLEELSPIEAWQKLHEWKKRLEKE